MGNQNPKPASPGYRRTLFEPQIDRAPLRLASAWLRLLTDNRQNRQRCAVVFRITGKACRIQYILGRWQATKSSRKGGEFHTFPRVLLPVGGYLAAGAPYVAMTVARAEATSRRK